MTSGLKLTHSTSLTTKFGFEYSLSASLSVPIEGLILGMGSMATIKYEVESTVDDSDEKTWSRSDMLLLPRHIIRFSTKSLSLEVL